MASRLDIPQDKKALRREMVARRDAMAPGQRARFAEKLTERLVALPEYAAARSVLATMAIGSEWATRGFLERARADGKALVLPRITPAPRHLELHMVEDLESDLVPGVWDIPEPDLCSCDFDCWESANSGDLTTIVEFHLPGWFCDGTEPANDTVDQHRR